MFERLKVRKFGGSLGIILSKNVAGSLALQEGDELFVSATAEGVSISPYDPEFASALDDARDLCARIVTPFVSWPNNASYSSAEVAFGHTGTNAPRRISTALRWTCRPAR